MTVKIQWRQNMYANTENLTEELLANSQTPETIFPIHFRFLLQSILNFLKVQRSALCTRGDSPKVCACQRFERVLPLSFYGGSMKDCRVGLPGLLCPGDTVCVKVAALVGLWELVFGWMHQACGEYTSDWEPGSECPFFPWRSATRFLVSVPAPVPSAPPAVPPRAGQVISAHVRASPEPSCCACAHLILAESNSWSHSDGEDRRLSQFYQRHGSDLVNSLPVGNIVVFSKLSVSRSSATTEIQSSSPTSRRQRGRGEVLKEWLR